MRTNPTPFPASCVKPADHASADHTFADDRALGARSVLVEGAVAYASQEAEPGQENRGALAVGVDAPLYSIRVPGRLSHPACELCGRHFVVAGPTGHLDDEPICDLCMLERDTQLGMVLALIAVTRSYGRAWPEDELEEDHTRFELMAFARIYETQAAKYAPARPVDPDWLWPSLDDELG